MIFLLVYSILVSLLSPISYLVSTVLYTFMIDKLSCEMGLLRCCSC